MTTFTYKFGAMPVHTAVKSKGRDRTAATVRYDDEREVQADDWIEIVKASDDVTVGYAIVEAIEEVELKDVMPLIEARGALYGIDSYSDLIFAMNEYYAREITATTKVKIIFYKTMHFA